MNRFASPAYSSPPPNWASESGTISPPQAVERLPCSQRAQQQRLTRGSSSIQFRQAVTEARRLLAGAHLECNALRLEAEAEYERGYRAGLDAGAAQISLALKALEETRAHLLEELEPTLLELLRTIAESVLAAELQTNPHTLSNRIKCALQSLRPLSSVSVRVNPAAIPHLIDLPPMLRIEGDATLAEGTFSLCTTQGELFHSPLEHLSRIFARA